MDEDAAWTSLGSTRWSWSLGLGEGTYEAFRALNRLGIGLDGLSGPKRLGYGSMLTELPTGPVAPVLPIILFKLFKINNLRMNGS